MNLLSFKIHLLTDAEPGTGLGSVNTDNYIPRNHSGRPTIPASHIKGLMREELMNIERHLTPENFSTDSILGKGGESLKCQGKIRVAGPVLDDENQDETLVITRTAIDPQTGTASDKALRTTESLAAGSVLENGSVMINAERDSAEDLAVRLALRSIAAVGGNRNRGSGRCRVEIEGEARSPGELLRALLKTLAGQKVKSATSIPTKSGEYPLNEEYCWVDMVFRADQSVCCPENPTRSNAIQGGFAIPASAVMGTLLHRVNNENSALATACFKSEGFRPWPLLPCAVEGDDKSLHHPVRVSLTHRVAKLASVKAFLPEYAQDQAIEPYDVRAVPADNPLKASDGVLLHNDQETILWKSSEMPREIRAHGALNSSTDSLDGKVESDGRGLYQMTAMAPMIWRGIASVPKEMSGYICGEWQAAFGKHRGTMGGGRLTIEHMRFQDYINGHPGSFQVFIAQSPILLPRGTSSDIAGTFAAMIETWCGHHGLPPVETGASGPLVWISAGIRFGWNRHRNGYAGAEKVVLPGSVFRLKSPPHPDNLKTALRAGLGRGRDQGFGTLAAHPGKAGALLNREATPFRTKTSGNSLFSAVKTILPLRDKPLPSVSQLYTLKNRLETGGADNALDYLRNQSSRDAHIAAAWRDAKGPLEQILGSSKRETAGAAIKMLADFAGKQGGEN